MKKLTLGLGVLSLVVMTGCANIHFAEVKDECRKGVFVFVWDVCDDSDNPAPIPRQKIRGDEDKK